jgi:hypothetical protein
MIFFEAFISNNKTLQEYKKTLHYLYKNNYKKFLILDNLGNIVLKNPTIYQILDLFDNILENILRKKSEKTPYYDILTYTKNNQTVVDRARKNL